MIVILARVQIKLNPYKLAANNELELMALAAILCTLMSGTVFASDDPSIGFRIVASILLFISNFRFILNWLYLFLKSFNISKPWVQKILATFGWLLMRKQTYNDKIISIGNLNIQKELPPVVIMDISKRIKKLKKLQSKVKSKGIDHSEFNQFRFV